MGELERQHAVKDPVAMPSAQRSEQIQQEDGYSNFAFKKKLIDKSFHYYSKSSQVKPDLTDPNAEFEDEVTGVDVTVKMSRTIFFFQP